MSIKIQSLCWDVKLPPTTKLVLVCLADYADEQGRCFPSAKTIADKTGLNERSVRRAIASLEAEGHITRTFFTGKRTDYIVNPCQSVTPDTQSPLTEDTKPLTHSPRPLTEDTKTPDRGVNITTINHHEPSVTTSKRLVVASAPTDASRGTRLPAEWQLSRPLGEWAMQQGMTADAVRLEADKFRDYWHGVAGAKGRKADWAATWRNWIRKADKSTAPQTFIADHTDRSWADGLQ